MNAAGSGESPDIKWNSFFEELALCEDVAETVNPARFLKNLKSCQKLFFPDLQSGPDGVLPRRFIIAHPESGRLYAKMIFTNVLINQLKGDKSRKQSAREEIWKAQSSALFCSRGQNSRLLRSAAYSALLAAESVTREKGKFIPSLVSYDFNMDGAEEWLLQDAKLNCYIQTKGGGIFELDYVPRAWNYLDTCGGRIGFSDRLLPVSFFDKDKEERKARNCGGEFYSPAEIDKVRRKLRLVLHPVGFPGAQTGSPIPFGSIEIEKTFMIKKDVLTVGYSLVNRGGSRENFLFAPEIDLAFPGEGETFARFFSCKAGAADAPLSADTLRNAERQLAQMKFSATESLKIHDIKNEVQITFAANRPLDGQISPVYIRGAESELFQAYVIAPCCNVSLAAGEKWEIEFTLRFSH
jgi:hypothetical protein